MMDNEVGRSDDDNDDVDEVAEMQQAVPRQQWREEATKDRLIGKMLREVSQFVVVLQPSEDTDDSGGAVGASMEPGALNRVQYVRGNKAVVHTNDFLKSVLNFVALLFLCIFLTINMYFLDWSMRTKTTKREI